MALLKRKVTLDLLYCCKYTFICLVCFCCILICTLAKFCFDSFFIRLCKIAVTAGEFSVISLILNFTVKLISLNMYHSEIPSGLLGRLLWIE